MSNEFTVHSNAHEDLESTELPGEEDSGADRSVSADALRGSIDFLEHNKLFGSAWDHSDPSRTVEVEIFLADKFIARETADKYRQDLALAGIGDGCHGFEYEFSSLLDFDPESIRVKYRNSDISLTTGPFFGRAAAISGSSDERTGDETTDADSGLVTLQASKARLDGIDERTKKLAARKDLGKVHDSLMTAIKSTNAKADEIVQSGTRIEGFLNIELTKKITKDLDLDGLKGQYREIDSRLRKASYARLFIIVLILGLTTVFMAVQPIDWLENWLEKLRQLF